MVLSPDEVNVFGTGDVIRALAEAFPEGWYGGALPRHGYWGRQGAGDEVVRFLERLLGDSVVGSREGFRGSRRPFQRTPFREA